MAEPVKREQPKIPSDIGNLQDVPLQDVMFGFDGAWMPSHDAALIGAKNFKTLTNMRYGENGIEGVNGYVSRVTNPISTYTNIQNGIHFRTNRAQDSYTLVQAKSDAGAGVVLQNKTAIGSVGDFESTELWTDSATLLDGRFSLGPSGTVAYANGRESVIWSGEEANIGAVFRTQASEGNPVDFTENMQNSRSDKTASIGGSRAYWTIMTTRPVKGFKFYVTTANTSTATLGVSYWDGTAYTSVSNLSDGTSSGGIALAQTGNVSFDSTVDVAEPHHFQERYLYSYQIHLPAGTASMSQVTADMPMQEVTNVWDGIYRIPIQCQVYTAADTAYEDFTLHVSESSTVNTPVGCIMDGFVATNDQLIVMFEEQMSGIKMTMLGNLINKAGGTLSLETWEGSTWQSQTLTDDTDALSKSGLMSWQPPTNEKIQTLFGTQGYAYRITTDTTMTGTKGGGEEVVVDIMSGVPARKDIEVYNFPVLYKNKLFLCGYDQGNEGNRIDYCADNAPDVWNGENSSLDGFQSIYVGGIESLTAAAQLYNRYGSNIFTTLTIFKNNEMYLLTGDGPLDYTLYPVSFTVGCPAPMTLTSAEVGLNVGADAARNVVLWVSHTGPMMFDGATLIKATGLEKFFDPNEQTAVNWDVLKDSRGWFDSTYSEWNILVPLGSSLTLDGWFVYDILRKKWFKKETDSGANIVSGWNVVADSGDQYVYGGSTNGKMYQLETGTSWDGENIVNTFQTGDFFPSNNQWDITRIRRFKFIAKRLSESDAEIELIYTKDTNEELGTSVTFWDVLITNTVSATAGVAWTDITDTDALSGNAGVSWESAPTAKLELTIGEGLDRLVRTTENFNETGWCHNFKFQFTSNETPKGIQPIGWGVQWELVRKDEN